MQFLLNTLAVGGIGALAAVAFYPVLITNRAFVLSAALSYIVGGYAYLVVTGIGAPKGVAALVGIAAASGISAFVDWCVLQPFRKRNVPSWKLLIVTLGVFVVGQNIISVLFGDDSVPLKMGTVQTGIALAGAHISVIQFASIVTACVVTALVWFVLNRTAVGRTIRGVYSNPDLAFMLGHNPEGIRLQATIVGSAVAGLTGILVGLDTGLTPMLGFRLLLNGIVVILITGMSGVLPLLAGALLLAFLQNFAAMLLGIAWMESVPFAVLITFLIWKPLGISGRRLKKVEV